MHHAFAELWARGWTAMVLAALGTFQVVRPGFFYTCSVYFDRARKKLSPAQSERLQRVLDARSDAEGVSPNAERYAGIVGIAMAGLELVPAIPFGVPYAIYCLAGALTILSSYVQIRRATQRRAAPLVPRSPFDALPPAMIAALAACFSGVALFAIYPPYRAGAIGVGAAMLILAWIAWRIAGSQAVLFGDDPQLEYAVDERLRANRVSGTVALACAPAVVLVGTTAVWIPSAYQSLGAVAMLLTYVAFGVAMFVNLMARRGADRLLSRTNG